MSKIKLVYKTPETKKECLQKIKQHLFEMYNHFNINDAYTEAEKKINYMNKIKSRRKLYDFDGFLIESVKSAKRHLILKADMGALANMESYMKIIKKYLNRFDREYL